MADPKVVAKKDGKAFRTGQVQVEDGYFVAADYKLTLCEEQEIGATGRLKVVHLVPLDEKVTDPCFIGRWDEKANFLDFDAVDRRSTSSKASSSRGTIRQHSPVGALMSRFAQKRG